MKPRLQSRSLDLPVEAISVCGPFLDTILALLITHWHVQDSGLRTPLFNWLYCVLRFLTRPVPFQASCHSSCKGVESS